MTATTGEIVDRLKLSSRPSASRKLLARKAAERQGIPAAEGGALEDAFPPSAMPPVAAQRAPGRPTAPVAAQSGQVVPVVPKWSDEDESAFQGLSARRRAAGYQRRGRDVGGQALSVGKITPNANTVSAMIVGLVAEQGTLTRSALLAAMAGAVFPHPKAKPQDRNWCQGYVAGALRDGFLTAEPGSPEAVTPADVAADQP